MARHSDSVSVLECLSGNSCSPQFNNFEQPRKRVAEKIRPFMRWLDGRKASLSNVRPNMPLGVVP